MGERPPPPFDAVESLIFAGEVGTVVCYKLDRLSRSLRDGINTLAEWCEAGIRVVSVTQQIDLSGTVGQMIAAVLLGVAQMEQETRRERQRVGIDIAKTNGKYRGRKNGTAKAKSSRAAELSAKGLTNAESATAFGVSRRSVPQ